MFGIKKYEDGFAVEAGSRAELVASKLILETKFGRPEWKLSKRDAEGRCLFICSKQGLDCANGANYFGMDYEDIKIIDFDQLMQWYENDFKLIKIKKRTKKQLEKELGYAFELIEDYA